MCNCISKDRRFVSVGSPGRIWVISAIHGEIDKLTDLHDTIYNHIHRGDRIIYTGNYMGYGPDSCAVIDEILSFCRAILAKPGMLASDIVYLRGAQEEMFQKLLQLQFAPSPLSAFTWMLGNGLSNTLYAYGLSPHDGIEACNQGIVGLSIWTTKVRKIIKARAGHDTFATHLVRAAHTDKTAATPLLFVSAGFDGNKPLSDQGDNFWWASQKFDAITEALSPFHKIIRGYDPEHRGVALNCVKSTIDGGCGFGGSLVCAVLDPRGEMLDMLEC